MLLITVLGRSGRPLCSLAECALCEQLRRPEELDVFEGPGQSVVACINCLAEFESWCEGRSQIEPEEVAA